MSSRSAFHLMFDLLQASLRITVVLSLLTPEPGRAGSILAQPGIVPPHSTVEGGTVGDWLGESWKWAFELPVETNPNVNPDVDCGFRQSGPVFFLPTPAVPELCTVPAETYILVDLRSWLVWADVGRVCHDCDSCGAAAGRLLDGDVVVELDVEVDGITLPDVFAHREMSHCFSFDLPANDILNLPDDVYPPGRRTSAVAEGYVVMLEPPDPGAHVVKVRRVLQMANGTLSTTERTYEILVERHGFLRGDCNDDGRMDISDAISILDFLFLGAGAPACDDACDSNDDGDVNITDAIATLGVLFLGRGTIPPPGMNECGEDPTDDELSCETPPTHCP